MKKFIIILISILNFSLYSYSEEFAPTHLTTDMLEHTDVVFHDGYITDMALDNYNSSNVRYQIASVNSTHPMFGWVINSDSPNTYQTSYRILVASSKSKLKEGECDMWDSGKFDSDNSVAVKYYGEELLPSSLYYWTVKVWDNHGHESPYAETKCFMTSETLDGTTPGYPLQITDDYPDIIQKINSSEVFIAFKKAAFGKLRLTLKSNTCNDTITIRIGEKAVNGRIARKPKNSNSSIRYAEYKLHLLKGEHTYTIKIRPDRQNTDPNKSNGSGVLPIFMPEYIGEVYPFRYCEIKDYPHDLKPESIIRQNVNYPFDDDASYFCSSDSVLNKVWDFCKHSVKATSFAGIYVDGDRERIPYEADALIGQLCHYSVDREYSMARRTHEHLLLNPTWPTEWNLQSILIAWADYMYTGNSNSISKFYDNLKAKTLLMLQDENNLISTKTGKLNKDVYKALNFKGSGMRDIVDWPQSGFIGSEKEFPGETDGYIHTDYNTVVNAFHYQAIKLMSKIAEALSKEDDRNKYEEIAKRVRKSFNRAFFDKSNFRYKDGTDTEHSSLHANMFPLAFGLVEEKYIPRIAEYIKQRNMACSVYGAQFLMESLYQAESADYALQLLTSTNERSWYNMLRSGSTISMEAWDDKYKPNQDWNHIWGAVPANIIPRGLFGIEPIEPGFKRFRIKPQPGSLEYAEYKMPTIRGDIIVHYASNHDKSYNLNLTIPANSESEVWVPIITNGFEILLNGLPVKENCRIRNFAIFKVGSGNHNIIVRHN